MGCCDMKWIKNLESIAITKTSGKCPGVIIPIILLWGISESMDMVKFGVVIVNRHIICQGCKLQKSII